MTSTQLVSFSCLPAAAAAGSSSRRCLVPSLGLVGFPWAGSTRTRSAESAASLGPAAYWLCFEVWGHEGWCSGLSGGSTVVLRIWFPECWASLVLGQLKLKPSASLVLVAWVRGLVLSGGFHLAPTRTKGFKSQTNPNHQVLSQAASSPNSPGTNRNTSGPPPESCPEPPQTRRFLGLSTAKTLSAFFWGGKNNHPQSPPTHGENI